MVYTANERRAATTRTFVLCVENQAAVDALAKGSSSSDFVGALVGILGCRIAGEHSAADRVCRREVEFGKSTTKKA